MSTDRRTGLAGTAVLLDEVDRERQRAERSGRRGHVAVLGVHEAESVRARFGARGVDELTASSARRWPRRCRARDGRAAPGRPVRAAAAGDLARRGGAAPAGARPSASPAPADRRRRARDGHAGQSAGPRWRSARTARGARAGRLALGSAEVDLDLRPVPGRRRCCPAPAPAPATRTARLLERLRTPFQVLITLEIGWGLPFVLYYLTDRAGVGVAPVAYVVVVCALLVTAVSIWVEGLLSLDPYQPPRRPRGGAGRAAVPAGQRGDRRVPAQRGRDGRRDASRRSCAWTTPARCRSSWPTTRPVDLPVEAVLRPLGRRDPRLLAAARSRRSTSKAQNVNAALRRSSPASSPASSTPTTTPTPTSFRARLALAGRRLRRRAGPPRRPQRRRLLGRPHGRRRVRDDLRGQPPRPRPAARLRHLRRLQRLLAHRRCCARPGSAARCSPRTSTPRCASSRRGTASAPTRGWCRASSRRRRCAALWNQRMRWAQGWFQVSERHLAPG